MKKLAFTLAIITLLVTFTSCTADELSANENEALKSQPSNNTTLNKDGEPVIIPIKP